MGTNELSSYDEYIPYCETQLQVSISWVSPCCLFVCRHLSPLYDVLGHTNHMFYECLSSGDDIDGNEDLQKDKTYKKTRPYIYQKQGVPGFKILYWTSSCDDKDKNEDLLLFIIRADYFSGAKIFRGEYFPGLNISQEWIFPLVYS